MKIVCASSVLHGEEAFSTLGEVRVVPDGDIAREHLSDADALITRSKTRINQALLEGTRVAFVGTATAGIDHIDTGWLEANEIAWHAAGGCNANSVAEYITAALLCLVQRRKMLLKDVTLGIVGVGNVGSAVAEKARALGLGVLLNDPPRQIAEDNPPALLPLAEVLEGANAVTLHVPLTDTGPWATRRMADCRFFEKLRPGSLFFNASRGEVVDEESLEVALERGIVSRACLDVWDREPTISTELLDRVDLGTAHIAGYSYEGKLKGTAMVYRAACGFFERPAEWSMDAHAAADPPPPVEIDARGRLEEDVLYEAVRAAYDIEEDDRLMREAAARAPAGDGAFFRELRRTYRVRREFPCTTIRLHHAPPDLARRLAALGLTIEAATP